MQPTWSVLKLVLFVVNDLTTPQQLLQFQRTLPYFISIAVRLNSSLTGLDLAKQVNRLLSAAQGQRPKNY